ncbi:hypothetical protein QL285_050412 [Trifolium repens]|nr:hypothetical protein QL285_050412 [Trifolium repens]
MGINGYQVHYEDVGKQSYLFELKLEWLGELISHYKETLKSNSFLTLQKLKNSMVRISTGDKNTSTPSSTCI